MDLGGEKLDLEPRELLPAKKGDCSEAAAEVWLLSCPHAHAADSGGSRLSPAVTPATQPCQDCIKSTGFGGQPGLGSNLSFQTLWLIASDR